MLFCSDMAGNRLSRTLHRQLRLHYSKCRKMNKKKRDFVDLHYIYIYIYIYIYNSNSSSLTKFNKDNTVMC
jgi:hypothetical protein